MPQSVARPTKPCRLEWEIVQNPLARPAVCRIASRPRRSRAIKAELGIRLAVVVHPGCTNSPVQPGCTNLGLSTLLFSKTNADHDGRVGCSQARAKAEPNSSTAGVHSRTDIRRTANDNTLGRLFAIMGIVESRSEWTVPRCARATVTISNFIASAALE